MSKKEKPIIPIKMSQIIKTIDMNNVDYDNASIDALVWQIEELKAENERLKEENKLFDKQRTDIARKHNYDKFEIDDLKQQLKEKDEEHEALINQFEEETEKLRKQIKHESDARKRLVKAIKEKDDEIERLKEQFSAMSEKSNMIKKESYKLKQSQNQKALFELRKVFDIVQSMCQSQNDKQMMIMNLAEFIYKQIDQLEKELLQEDSING